MTQVQKRALYNLLRMNALSDPTMKVQPWQIEDYRLLTNEELFKRLADFSFIFDKISFVAHADNCDSPEEMAENLIEDRELTVEQWDRIYLATFELWRRLMPEKPSLSILCDELDYQIYLYDEEKLESQSALESALNNFIRVLEQNVDAGLDPHEAFNLASEYCANDLKSFLYDYISDQLENGDDIFARDLLENLRPYVDSDKWFLLLAVKVGEQWPEDEIHEQLELIINQHLDDNDIAFNFELLDFMVLAGPHGLFYQVVEKTIPLFSTEEDFKDLLSICLDYFQRIDQSLHEKLIQEMIDRRSNIPPEKSFNPKDSDIAGLLSIIKK